MIKSILTLGCLAVVSLTLAGCGKEEAPATPASDITVPTSQPATTQPQAKAQFDNELCPVGKHPISGKGVAVEYKGKTYGFCCDDCAPVFKADPEKYLASSK
ncbi:MAG: YHS domain-containing protein [Phycisphaeraceae bacterium JB051]